MQAPDTFTPSGFMRLRRRWDWVIFAFAIGLLALATLQSFLQSRESESHNRLVAHTVEVLSSIEAIDRASLLMEADHRTHLMLGTPSWAEARAHHHEQANAAVDKLVELVVDNPAQSANVAEVRRLLGERFASMERRSAQIERESVAAAQQQFLSEGTRSFDALQGAIAVLGTAERQLLSERSQRAADSVLNLRGSLLYGPGIALIILAVGFVILRRQLDATERMRAALARSDAVQKAMLNGAGHMVIAVDAQNEIIVFNRAASRKLGYAAEDVLGGRENVARFHDPDEISSRAVELTRELGTRVLPGPEVFTEIPRRELAETRQWTYVARDGRTFPGQLTVSSIRDDEGRLLGFIGMAEDISERVRAEHEIQELNTTLEAKAEQLEETVAELESFSYSISHDLRAPLRHIHGYARMLEEDAAGALDAECARYLTAISDSSRRMGLLIDDLLSLSRMGRKPLQITMITMANLVQAALEEARTDATQQAIVSIGDLPDAAGDPALLRQVWVNLISNAIKYSSRRGEDARVSVSGAIEGGHVRYQVRDNGIGFDMRFVDKLFGVFQRLHIDEEFEGTGVGLAIVQRIVLRHGGRVSAVGAPDAGATFSFTLPYRGPIE